MHAAARASVAAMLAACLLPVTTAGAAPSPSPRLSEILAEPPTTAYVEVQSHTPGILEGPFDAGEYASIGGANMRSTLYTLGQDGFIAGYGRAWVQQEPQRVMVEIVVAFTGGKGARQWLQQSQEADLADPTFQHSISVDGIESYYGARMSDTTSYFADNFVFVKGNDGFLVSTISSSDDLGDSAAAQARVQYRQAPAYTIPPSGWPGAKAPGFTVASATTLAGRLTIGLVAASAAWWVVLLAAARWRRRPTGRYGSSGL